MREIELKRVGGGVPWGFRISQYSQSSRGVKVTRVNPGSVASGCGLRENDIIEAINGSSTNGKSNQEIQSLLNGSDNVLISIGNRMDAAVSSSDEEVARLAPVWNSAASLTKTFKPVRFTPPLPKETVVLPNYPSPTMTLLQKAREGQLPKGPSYSTFNTTKLPPPPSSPFEERHSEEEETIIKIPNIIRKNTLKFEGGIQQWATQDSGLVASCSPPPPPLSLAEQRQLYVEIQKGGNVPLHGLRKTVKCGVGAGVSGNARYNETQVNIHYLAPVRLEEKAMIAEDELLENQKRAMNKFYAQQRQRKYLEEIQDQQQRRHSDFLTPSQKSPIPLDRYDNEYFNARKYARALYDFVPENRRELRLLKNGLVEIRRVVDLNWYEGVLPDGTVGIFPKAYVQVEGDLVKERPQPQREVVWGVAVYGYKPVHEDELCLEENDRVHVVEKCPDGWFVGTNQRTGLFGTFPGNYVTLY